MYSASIEKSDIVITRCNDIIIHNADSFNALNSDLDANIYKEALFFDLEHYVYKKPVCIGVFGCCYYEDKSSTIKVTQYMIEDNKDALEILNLAEKYFKEMAIDNKKKYIVTFSGNNDYTVINYLLKKYDVDFNFDDYYEGIDLQKEYEKATKKCIGLKALEKEFGIEREGELISGSNLAKTFSKIVKDKEYFKRMPDEKKEKILLYNEQDVVNLFHIFLNWNKVLKENIDLEENIDLGKEL